MRFSNDLVSTFWRDNSNEVEITIYSLTFEKLLPLLKNKDFICYFFIFQGSGCPHTFIMGLNSSSVHDGQGGCLLTIITLPYAVQIVNSYICTVISIILLQVGLLYYV